MSAPGARPAYEELADLLRAQILAGTLQPGDRLPVEPELSARYGVSRSTVREALRVLSSQHLVTTTRGVSGGTFVMHPNLEQIAGHLEVGLGLLSANAELSVEQLLEVRDLVEVPAAGLAAERATPAQLSAVRATLVDPREAEPGQMHACNHRFHMLLIEAAGNPLLAVVARPVFGVLTTRFVRGDAAASFWDTVLEDHRGILRRVEAGDAAGARAAMHEHLVRLRVPYERIDRGATTGAALEAPSV
ncbi:MAG: FCD domain-containing protein [Candidatus Nanopelagicales bacterium]|jgi:DNA-binding FadR family transcriptional regulator